MFHGKNAGYHQTRRRGEKPDWKNPGPNRIEWSRIFPIRFIGKGIVVSGGTAALDSVIEKKFAKKAKLLEANMNTVKAAHQYAIDQGWTGKAAKKETAAV